MANPKRLDLRPILPFLPAEPGLRAHLFRVSALAARAAAFKGYAEESVQDIGWAGLLHHYAMDPPGSTASGNAVPAALVRDLGLESATGFAPLPEGASAIVRSFRRADADASEMTSAAALLLESANLFDEQMENLPYEDKTTERAVAELLESGLIATPFREALASFRVTARTDLSIALTALPAAPLSESGEHRDKFGEDVRTYFETAHQAALWEHSLGVASEISRAASLVPFEAFCAGLMHDVGRLAYLQSVASGPVTEWQAQGFPADYSEFLVSGTDHAEVGSDILARKGFPPAIVEAVKYHQRPELTDSLLAAAICAFEGVDEVLPSCARDHLAAKRIDLTELRRSRAHGC